MPDFFPFDPEPRSPIKALPPLACDSQFHVFGSRERYPVLEGAAYEMPTATIDRALHMHEVLGFRRGVIVQSTTYGAHSQNLLDGLAKAGPGYRGCAHASVLKEGDDAYIARLQDAGVGGARFTRSGLGAAMDANDVRRALDRATELGWYVKVQPEMKGVAGVIEPFRNLRTPLVIDHMGRPDPEEGDADPSLRCVLDMLKEGNTWVMLTLGEKISKEGRPFNDAVHVAQQIVAAAPDRCIWGSDWPHPVSTKPVPNDAEFLELLYRYVPDEATLHKVLVDNPATLFRFD